MAEHDVKNLLTQILKKAAGAATVKFCIQGVSKTNCISVELNLEVVEFDGVGVEDLLLLLLGEVGDQLHQQVNHLARVQTIINCICRWVIIGIYDKL